MNTVFKVLFIRVHFTSLLSKYSFFKIVTPTLRDDLQPEAQEKTSFRQLEGTRSDASTTATKPKTQLVCSASCPILSQVSIQISCVFQSARLFLGHPQSSQCFTHEPVHTLSA